MCLETVPFQTQLYFLRDFKFKFLIRLIHTIGTLMLKFDQFFYWFAIFKALACFLATKRRKALFDSTQRANEFRKE